MSGEIALDDLSEDFGMLRGDTPSKARSQRCACHRFLICWFALLFSVTCVSIIFYVVNSEMATVGVNILNHWHIPSTGPTPAPTPSV